jgi:hypothetical protein
MLLQNITSESNLREWLRESRFAGGIKLQWVEPGLYGSTMGAADVIIKRDDIGIQTELKYLHRNSHGIKFTVRPVQRRFHHMSMKHGGQTCLLFVLSDTKQMFVVRGDRIPLRDYASDKASGCANGKVDTWPVLGTSNEDQIFHLTNILFGKDFWI